MEREYPSYEEVHYADTRAGAIALGVIIDVSDYAAQEGIKHPVAFTDGAYVDAITEHCRGALYPECERVKDLIRYIAFLLEVKTHSRIAFTYPTRDGEGTAYFLDLIATILPGDGVIISRPEDN